jgi:hypothetical protein
MSTDITKPSLSRYAMKENKKITEDIEKIKRLLK